MSRLQITGFGSGLWLPEGREFTIPTDALLTADNIEYLRSGGVQGRRGRAKLNSSALDGGDPIRALWRHYPRTGTKNTLAFVDVGASVTAYKADDASGTFASATTGLPDDSAWNFATWSAKNKTFIASGSTGGLWQWNGTAVSTVSVGEFAELLSDGSFASGTDWTFTAGWTHDVTNKEADHSSGITTLSQTLVLAVGRTYTLVFTVKNVTTGTVTPKVGNVTGTARSTNATFTQDFTATATTGPGFTPSTDFNGSITDVSLRQKSSIANDFGPYITIHKSRLWVTKVSELNYSVYASEINDETTWLSASQLSVNDPQGGLITGLASFFDFLLIFKETSLFRFVGDISTVLGAQLALYSDYGCIAPQSIAVTPYGVIFVGRQGVYITDGIDPNPAELSKPINALFVTRDSQTQYPNAIGRWHPNKQQYVLKLDPTAADAYVLSRIDLLVDNPFVGERSRIVWVWSRHTNLPAISMTVWDSEQDDGRLVTGDDVGFVHIYDSGDDDDSTPITSTLQTASVPIDNTPEREGGPKFRSGRVKRVKLLHRAATTVSGELLYDQAAPGGGAPFTIGDTTLEEKFPRANISDQTLLGRFISLWLRNTSSNQDFEIHVADFETRLFAPRVWRDDNDGVSSVLETEGNVVISGTATEAAVTLAAAQTDTNYEIAFGIAPSAGVGPTTVGIKPGTKATTGFTVEVGGAPGTGNSYTVSWILSRAA